MKNKLIPMTTLLVTRSRKIYWYIGKDFKTENECICMSPSIDCNLNTWQDNLLCIRDGSVYIAEKEPRLHDIIYIFEISNMSKWLYRIRNNRFINYEDIKNYILKYERIDNQFESVS